MLLKRIDMRQKNLATTISCNLELLKKTHVRDSLIPLVCILKSVESQVVPGQDLIARKTTNWKHLLLFSTCACDYIYSFFDCITQILYSYLFIYKINGLCKTTTHKRTKPFKS